MPSAYGFESLRPHSIKAQSCDWAFIVSSRLESLPKTVRSKGLVAFIKWRGRSPPNHPGRPHSIKAQSSDWAFIVVLNEIRTGRGPRGAAGILRPWLTTGSGREIAPVADHGKRQGQLPLRRLFYLGLCRLRGILSPPAPTTVILQAGRSSVQQRCCSRRAVLLCRHEN